MAKIVFVSESLRPLKRIQRSRGFEDMERRYPNIEKLAKLAGFKPNHDLDSIIQSVIDYFKE